MEKYIISLDLDGTLLNKKSKISFRTRFYLRRLAKKGHVVFINTGRPYSGCVHLYRKLGIYKYPLCCNNGAVIAFFKDKRSTPTFETKPVDNKIMGELYEEIKPYSISGFALDEYEHYFFNMNSVPPFIQKYHKPKNPIFTTLEEITKIPVVSYTIYFDEINLDKVKNVLSNSKYNSLKQIFWGVHDDGASFNFASSEVSKATAIKRMQELYNIDDEHVIAFGDSYNDIDMLSYAKYGICMRNGRIDMVKKANYITKKDNDHNGIVDYLKKNFNL